MRIGMVVMLIELPPPDERDGQSLPLAVGDLGQVLGVCECCGLFQVGFASGWVWLWPGNVTQCA